MVCWGGHSIGREEYDYTKQVGYEMGLRDLDICTGCGPGAMKGPMKGATMVATLDKLGVTASFSRPSISNDNPYSESLFRTMKYRPGYPSKPFETIEQAQAWVDEFVRWYNTVHLHSAICFTTPDDRHYGHDQQILANRHQVYENARRRHPGRWAAQTRNWKPVVQVWLNPEKKDDATLIHPLKIAA